MCWAPGSVVWWLQSSPTRTGWRRSGLVGLFGWPRTVGCGSGGRRRTGWWPPAARYRRRRLRWPPGAGRCLGLLADLDAQIAAAEVKIAELLPDTPFAPLTTVPGWGVVRAANYGAAVGDPGRWPGARQLYRASAPVPGPV